jgi:hypothetical protein
VNYTCDWTANKNDDSGGRVIIEPDGGGQVLATWECRNGKGRGCELRENTTQWPNWQVENILDNPDLCQGCGEFIVDILETEEYPEIELVEWIG